MVEDAPDPMLPILHKRSVPHDLVTGLTTYCDPYDLIAVVSASTQDVQVIRINGQVAFTVKRRSPEVDVSALQFKPDGSVLAIGHSDGVCTLHSGENGRLIAQLSVRQRREVDDWRLDLVPDDGDLNDDDDEDGEEGVGVACIEWCTHVPPYDGAAGLGFKNGVSGNGDRGLAEEWADLLGDDDDGKETTTASGLGIKTLTDELTKLDVATVLPKLSPIPSHAARYSKEGAKFSTHAAVDSLLDAVKDAREKLHGGVDLLLVSNFSGHTVALMDDTVKIGETRVETNSSAVVSSAHCSSSVFISDKLNDLGVCEAAFLDLPMDTMGGALLHVISTNTKRIQNLLAYTTQTLRYIEQEWTAGTSLPSRMINNISEELDEKQEGDFVTSLYHLAMTGDLSDTMHEWLTDILKETNHKRWDQSINNMYTHIQDYIFINLLPGLERLSIAITTLQAHAEFHEGTSDFDVSPKLFSNILEGVDSLQLVAQKVLVMLASEHRQFAAFSKWLRVMIDVGMERGAMSSVETEEREMVNIDYGLLLQYIEHTLMGSKLRHHIGGVPRSACCSREAFFNNSRIREQNYENTVKALKEFDAEKLAETSYLLINMPAIAVSLNGHARFALESITAWQSKLIPASPERLTIPAPDRLQGTSSITDARMDVDETVSKITVLVADTGSNICLSRLERTFQAASGKNRTGMQSTHISISGTVLDAKLLDSSSALVLVQDTAGVHKLQAQSFAQEFEGEGNPSEPQTLHIFPGGTTFVPGHIVVGGRLGLRVCVVFSKKGHQWQVLELERDTGTSFGA